MAKRGFGSIAIRLFLSVILLLGIGVLDYYSGRDIGFSVFYLLPLFLAVQAGGLLPGLLIGILASIVWFAADASLAAQIEWYHYWNASIRLTFFVLFVYLLSRLWSSLEHERALARQDALTGLPNSRAFFEEAGNLLNRLRAIRKPVALAYLDCDHFKQVNDEQGHDAGDEVIRRIGSVLNSGVRSQDLLARLGGDEFAILMPGIRADVAEESMEALRQAIQTQMSDGGWPVTVSIGVVWYETSPDPAREMVRSADDLMYEAKSAGRNTVKVSVRKQ